jgi:peroxiredoxin
MPAISSSMLPLGTIAPEFNLVDVRTDEQIRLSALRSSSATVIMFLCNHCPYVLHIQAALVNVTARYQAKGIQFIAISSNDIDSYPADAPDKMRQVALANDYSFPYLFDATQAVAKAYHAACTPDFYIFDKQLACVYRGQFDDSRPGNAIPPSGQSLTEALDAMLAGGTPTGAQKPSLGCSIKWKF